MTDTSEAELLHGALVIESRGDTVVFPTREQYLELVGALKSDGFDMCSDLCGVDHLTNTKRTMPEGAARERFEIVVTVRSLESRRRVRIRVAVPQSDATLPSLFELYPGTEFMEREAFDMFGIRFDGHPDLVRILMPDDWEGHPLRKDYALGRIPVQFKEAPQPR